MKLFVKIRQQLRVMVAFKNSCLKKLNRISAEGTTANKNAN